MRLTVEQLECRAVPAVFINDLAVTEPDAGLVPVALTVRLSEPLAHEVVVQFGTHGYIYTGTAKRGEDYLPTYGYLTFAPGVTALPLPVQIIGDVMDEHNEALRVTLDGSAGDVISDPHGHVTLLDNDSPPVLSVSDVTVVEGDTGTTDLVFTVSLSAPSGKQVGVSFTTRDGTAVAGEDYVAKSGTLIFTPHGSQFAGVVGVTSRVVTVQVNGEDLVEADESFYLDLVAVTNAVPGNARGTGTIQDDDAKAPLIW